MIPHTNASPLSVWSNGETWYQNVYSQSHACPGIVPGLVHHPPLGTGQVLLLGQRSQVGPVGEEQQRLGVVVLVEAAAAVDELGVERAGLGQREEAAGQGRHGAVVALGHLGRVAVGHVAERRGVVRGPGLRWASVAAS